ncbi:Zinc-binding ribosomal protein [Phytophthora cactorum]|nr:Zinc-binding ribosomal protein [Phytophthora cactorum]
MVNSASLTELPMLFFSQGKAKNVVIKMLSAAGTGFFYTTTKNPRNVTRKLSLRKVQQAIINWVERRKMTKFY